MKILSTILPKASSALSYAKNFYSKTKDAVLFKNQPRVNIGWQYKTAEGLKEATLPLNLVINVPKIVKGMLIGTLLAGTTGSIYNYIVDKQAENAVESNIQQAKEKAEEKEEMVFDEKIPLPAKLAKATKNPATSAGRFYNALKDNKDNLMKDLDITSEEYNQLAVLALRLSREESSYGNGTKYKVLNKIYSHDITGGVSAGIRIAREMGNRVLNDVFSFNFDSIKEDFMPRHKDGALSLGMTAFKINNAAEDEKALFDKYGITHEDNHKSNIINPEQSAVATLIHMATLKKLYPVYLENAKSYMPDINDSNVKQSIKNAQKILFNDRLRPMAIEDLREGYYMSPGLDDKGVDEENMRGMGYLSRQEIEDLKVYARTVILSPEAHLIAMWNGRGVLPNPNKSRKALDETYINLLHVAAQKGYIANMDKKSHVIYNI